MAAIDRAGITAELSYRYTLLLTSAGIPATDTADGVGPVLNQVQIVADGDPDLTAQTLGTLARYLTLDVIVERLASKFDVSTGGDSYKLNQLYTNAKALKASLEAVIGWLALGDVAASAVGQVVTVSAPYLAACDEERGTWF